MSRKRDEHDRDILTMLAMGHDTHTICARLHTSPAAIQATLVAIRAEDCAHDPEAAAWWQANIRPPRKGRPNAATPP